MALKKLQLEPGKKVRGWGCLNEYGEFDFTPEETGSQKDRTKQIFQSLEDNYVIKETKNKIIVNFSLDKKDKEAILAKFINATTKALLKLKHYEF